MSRSTVHGANSNASLVALSSYTPSSWIHSFSVPDGIVDLLVAIQYTYSIYILLYVYLYKISMYADLISRWCSPDEFLTPWRRKFGVFPSQWGRKVFRSFFQGDGNISLDEFTKLVQSPKLKPLASRIGWWVDFFSGFVGMTHAIRVVTIKD